MIFEQDFEQNQQQDIQDDIEKARFILNKCFDILSIVESLLTSQGLFGCRRDLFRYVLRLRRIHKALSDQSNNDDNIIEISKLFRKAVILLIQEVRKCIKNQ